jgi:chemotaxis protein MotB
MAKAKEKTGEEKRPIIVKKVKKVAGGHHGGAWKVAYADFVTAMMAFFLLLWLLSTSSKDTLQGIAEYFTPTTGIQDSQGIGFKGGLNDSPEGVAKSDMASPGLVTGRSPQGIVADNPDFKAPEEEKQEDNLFRDGASAVTQAFRQDKALKPYSDNIRVEQTPEGLRINVMDTDKFPMFQAGTAALTEHGQLVLAGMTGLIKRMPNLMSITGHTDASPQEAGRVDYSKWELSSDRALTARRYMVKAGLERERTKRVTGMADQELLVPEEPRSPRNRRITLILLRGSHLLIPSAAVPEMAAPVASIPAQNP